LIATDISIFFREGNKKTVMIEIPKEAVKILLVEDGC
jgi:hypothetical protein